MERLTERGLLLLTLALAAGLRLYDLAGESLWTDELSLVTTSAPGPADPTFWASITGDVHPPGYKLLMFAWLRAFGDSEQAARMPSALAGIALCFALYALARPYFGAAVAISASALAAVSGFLVYYAQEARSYALVCLLVTCVAHAWLRLLHVAPGARMRPLLGRSLLAGALTAAAAYVHYSGLIASAIIIALITAYAATRQRAALTATSVAALTAGLLYAPWLPQLAEHLERGGLWFLKPPQLSEALGYPLTVLPASVWLVVALCTGFGAWDAWRQRKQPDGAASARTDPPRLAVIALLAGWAVLTLAAFYIKSRISTPIFNDRNLIVVAPPIIVLAAIGLQLGAVRIGAPRTLALLLACALSLHGLIVTDAYYTTQSKEAFRQAAQRGLAAASSSTPAEVVTLCYGRHFAYYLKRLGSPLPLRQSVNRSKQVLPAVEHAFAEGAEQVLVLWAHIKLSKGDRKRLAKGRRVLGEERLKGAGYVLIGR